MSYADFFLRKSLHDWALLPFLYFCFNCRYLPGAGACPPRRCLYFDR
jgi:hypothetical protein